MSDQIIKTLQFCEPSFAREVQVSENSLAHIATDHPVEYQIVTKIYQTIEKDATRIFSSKSKTGKTAYLVVNDNVTSPSSGDPLTIAMKVPDVNSLTGFISTAHYKKPVSQTRLLMDRRKK